MQQGTALAPSDQVCPVWRTSTPEPTRGDGIIWTHLKDVTRYIPLFAKPGTFILQLDNLLQQGLDGQYASMHAVHRCLVPEADARDPQQRCTPRSSHLLQSIRLPRRQI